MYSTSEAEQPRRVALVGRRDLLLRGIESTLLSVPGTTVDRDLLGAEPPDVIFVDLGESAGHVEHAMLLLAVDRFPTTHVVGLTSGAVGPTSLANGHPLSVVDISKADEDAISRLLGAARPAGPARASAAKALSERERRVIEGLADGRSDAAVAGDLGMAVTTVRSHVRRASLKLGLESRNDLIATLALTARRVPYEAPGVESRRLHIEVVMGAGLRRTAVVAALQDSPSVSSSSARDPTHELSDEDVSTETIVLLDWTDPRVRGGSRLTGRITLAVGPADVELAISSLRAGLGGYLSDGASTAEVEQTLRCAIRGTPVVPEQIQPLVLRALVERSAAEDDSIRALLSLTARERIILAELCDGASDAELAQRFVISHNTVRSHVRAVLHKMGVVNRVEAVAMAERHRLVERFLR